MKKILVTLLVLLLVVGCGSSESERETLKVSCTLDPHSKILEFVKPLLAEEGIDLEIQILDNYSIFNQALDAGEVDANYFQHVPFFENEVKEYGYDLANVAGVHIEPFGFYSKTLSDVSELAENANIIITNSVADQGRVLTILAKAGIIELSADPLSATLDDITANPLNVSFTEIAPELLVTAYDNQEGDLVAINGNYALAAGLNPVEDAVILEQADADNPYVNIIAVQSSRANEEKIQKFLEIIKSEAVKNFISETYGDGSVIPAE
ncbi:MAG: MetQ/NlpA family ABC transporter substrate-binding protein [Erysipelotrichaceae bacterium]